MIREGASSCWCSWSQGPGPTPRSAVTPWARIRYWTAVRCSPGGVQQRRALMHERRQCTALGSGWRLATLAQLHSIVDVTESDPAIDSNAFPSTPPTTFWGLVVGLPGAVWTVDFSGGGTTHSDASNPFRVRCVR